MLPITRANLQNFCRVCLRDISDENSECSQSEGIQTRIYLPNRMCSNCDIKLNALRKFRSKAIVATGVLRVIVDEERQKSAKQSAILSKLQSICRICFRNENLDNYITRDHAIDIFESTGLNMLKNNADSKDVLKDDPSFSDRLCNKCYTTIKSFLEFRTTSQQTADYLKNVFDEFGYEPEISCTENEKQETPELIESNNEINMRQKTSEATTFLDQSISRNIIQKKEKEVELERTASLEDNNSNLDVPVTKKCETHVVNSNLTEVIYLNENSSAEDLNLGDTTDSDNELESTNIFVDYSKPKRGCGIKNRCKKSYSSDHTTRVTKTKPDQSKMGVAVKELDSTSAIIKKQRASKTFQKAFKCVECNKSFYKKFMYEAHIKSVHENIEKPFCCPHCKASFRLVQVLHRHISCCHENIADNDNEFSVPRKPCHTCLLCQNTFKRKEHLKEHIRAVHEKLRPFKCGICSKTFGTKNTQMRHEKNHSNDKPFSCEYCAKRYNSESELKVHLQRHTSNPELLCPICKRAKRTVQELQEHIAMHKSSYQCTTCGKIFKKLFHLREHENTVHLKLRSLKCSYCDLTFTIRKTLKNHEKSHDAIGRPEKCPLCALNFKSKRALALHSKKEHMKNS